MIKTIFLSFLICMLTISLCFAETIKEEAERRIVELKRDFIILHLMEFYNKIELHKTRIKKLEKEIADFNEELFEMPENVDVVIVP